MKILIDKEAVKLALEMFKTAQNNLASSRNAAHGYGDGDLWDKYEQAIQALEQSTEQERIGSCHLEDCDGGSKTHSCWAHNCEWKALEQSTEQEHNQKLKELGWSPEAINKANTPQTQEAAPRKPLTDEEIAHATAPVFMGGNPSLTGIARAIEAAHGIGEKE